MAEIGNFFVTIGSKFEGSGVNKSIKGIEDLKRKTENAAKGFKIAGAALTAFATAGAVSILKLTKRASDLEETTAKFNTVFKGQEQLAKSWARTLVASYGVSTEQAKRFLASIQDLLVPMGMNAEVAAKLSNEVVKLSVDLGSFNNMPTEKVMMDIQSALVGNFETMKKYGVVLNETRIKQEIMNNKWVKSEKDITQSMKAQAAYNLIVAGSTAALGDFNRTSDGYANQVKIMQASIIDLAAKLGDKLLPTMKIIVEHINTFTKRLQALNPETVTLIAKVLLLTTAIAGILGPLALFLGFLPQIIIGLTQLGAAFKLAQIAAVKFFAVLAAHPLVAVTAALAALTLGVAAYWEKSLEAAESTREFGNSTNSLIAIQQKELEALKKIAVSSKSTNEEKIKAVEKYKLTLNSLRALQKKASEEAAAVAAEEARKKAAADTKGTKKRVSNINKWLKAGKYKEAEYTKWVRQNITEKSSMTQEWQEQKKMMDTEYQEFTAERMLTDAERWAQHNMQLFENTQEVTNGIADVFSGYMDLKTQGIQNDLEESISKENADYEQQRAHIMNNVTDEKERKKQLNTLETSHNARLSNLRSQADQEVRKQRSKQKPLMIAQAIANTAVGATKALATGGFPLGAILAALATAAGMFQVAKIKSQKFAQGGLVSSATPAIFGEAGPELALPLKSPNAIEALSAALAKAGAGMGAGGNIYVTVPPISTRGEARRMGSILGDEIMKKVKRNRKL